MQFHKFLQKILGFLKNSLTKNCRFYHKWEVCKWSSGNDPRLDTRHQSHMSGTGSHHMWRGTCQLGRGEQQGKHNPSHRRHVDLQICAGVRAYQQLQQYNWWENLQNICNKISFEYFSINPRWHFRCLREHWWMQRLVEIWNIELVVAEAGVNIYFHLLQFPRYVISIIIAGNWENKMTKKNWDHGTNSK